MSQIARTSDILHLARAGLTSASGGTNLRKSMSRISAFFGISIYMYYREHMPPHFHAIYAEHEAK